MYLMGIFKCLGMYHYIKGWNVLFCPVCNTPTKKLSDEEELVIDGHVKNKVCLNRDCLHKENLHRRGLCIYIHRFSGQQCECGNFEKLREL